MKQLNSGMRMMNISKRFAFAALAGLVATAGCDSKEAVPFELQGTGSLEGLVFFDADRNGVFDPAAGDSVIPGARVRVQKRGTSEVLAGGETVAGANGRFVIGSLPPGTHDLVLDTASASGVKFCQNPLPVNIYLNERQFQTLGGRIACIVSIADAQKALNQVVVIQGIVSSFPGQTRSEYTYVQDESGGIRVFSGVLEGKGIEIGDLIEVTGTISQFNNDFQLGGTVSLGTVQKNVQQPTPIVLTTGQISALWADPAAEEIGMLTTVRKAKFTTAFGAPPINGRNAWIDDGSGRTQIRFESAMFPAASTDAARDALNAMFPANAKCYDITGVTGGFSADAQIFPRTLSDIVEVPCS